MADHRERGKCGGRPPGIDKGRYEKRNVIERAISTWKDYRAVATRSDRRASVVLGTVTAAALVIQRRS
ncbi:hypothetical protein ACFV4P_28555 [Kitasatospora sp. NPDC059795]|uniref:hypothetical protein n=1 Tax=Kitasatospora sp. NPDC059795 TaxID=3346949 RepID=UPI00364757C8